MNTQQSQSFQQGAGNFLTASDTLFAVKAIGALMLLLFIAWVFVKAYNEYGTGNAKGDEMLFTWGRAVFILTVLMYVIAN